MINKENLYQRLNQGMLSERSRAFSLNLEKNQALIKKWGGLRPLIPCLKGKTVIVAGAGPSLDSGLAQLKKYQHRDNLIIIAADMAVRPLFSAGIRPAYVITCETTPVDYFGGIDTSGVELLAFSCASHQNLKRWRGGFRFYNWLIENEVYSPLWQRAGRELGSLATGSVVTTQAVSLVLGCETESLLMCGNDLGFNSSFYCRGTLRHRENIRSADRFLSHETRELRTAMSRRTSRILRGDMAYYTDNQFITAKLWLEDLFKKSAIPVYDCGAPGCSGPGINRIYLEDFLARFDKKRRGRRK